MIIWVILFSRFSIGEVHVVAKCRAVLRGKKICRNFFCFLLNRLVIGFELSCEFLEQ